MTATIAVALAFILVPVVITTQPAQAQTLTTLYSFKGQPDGAYPSAGLTRDAKANLYSTTESFGSFGGGTVFKVDVHGKETVLYNFCSATNCV